MLYDARAIANAVLDIASSRGLFITNMALNKILYFCQGWSLAQNGIGVVDAKFEAWEHGPVVPLIYHHFKRFRERPIRGRATMIDLATGKDVTARADLTTQDMIFVAQMVAFYGPKPGSVLRMMSHEPGAPWDAVWSQNETGRMVIRDEAIRAYFEGKLRTRGELSVN